METIESALLRLGISPEGLDLRWIEEARRDTALVLEELRSDPRFKKALPATAVWPELQWRMKTR